MAYLTSSELINIIPEAIPGEFEVTAVTKDVDVRVRDTSFQATVERDNESSEFKTGTWFSADESIVGQLKATASCSIKFAPGEYTPATVPLTPTDAAHKLNYKHMFETSGMNYAGIDIDVTDDAPGLHIFYPDQDKSQASASIARIVYDGATAKYHVEKAAGCIGNFTINAEGTAKPFMVKFDYSGKMIGVEDKTTGVASIDETKIMRTVADAMRNTTVTIKDLLTDVVTSFCITKFGLESGNEVNVIECQSSDSGILNYIITKIAPKFSMDPLLRSLLDFNYWEAISTERFYEVNIQSEYLKLNIPRAQINAATIADSNGSLRNEMQIRPLINLDASVPTWIPNGTITAAKLPFIPYFLGISEAAASY